VQGIYIIMLLTLSLQSACWALVCFHLFTRCCAMDCPSSGEAKLNSIKSMLLVYQKDTLIPSPFFVRNCLNNFNRILCVT